jgi:hypothetical protein
MFTIRNSVGSGEGIVLRFEPRRSLGDALGRSEAGAGDFIVLWAVTKLVLSPSSIERWQLARSTFSRQAIEGMGEKKCAGAVTGGRALARPPNLGFSLEPHCS